MVVHPLLLQVQKHQKKRQLRRRYMFWKSSESLMSAIMSSLCIILNCLNHTQDTKEWINDFIGLGHLLEGHQKKCVTPYMHILAYHVPDQIKRHGNIRRFSGQGNMFMYYTLKFTFLYRSRKE